ncbi:MAG: diguanylate cyclase [Gammaproteobacteria bacterium]|nr:diguanylate cyclase [Gammaproteobacteria bacterium]
MTKENPSAGIPGRGFPRRVYPARVIGVGLGFISVAGVFVSAGAPPWAWLLLILNGFVWPHIAFLSARRAADPSRAERRNLMIDALGGGFWVALMQFNLLPSALLLAMLSMDNMALGGMRLFLRGLLAHLAGMVAGVLLVGWAPAPVTNVREMLFCLPFLLIYPQLVGNITFQLAQRLDAEKRNLLERSRIDALTGLWNRGYWQERALAELSRCRRQGTPAVLVLADIDHFKSINDRYGHGVGDQVLRRLAALLQKDLRISDILCRYGGEEFAMVLPDTECAGALVFIERLRETIMRCDLGPDYPGRVTVSFGLAQLAPVIADLPTWTEAADTALYQAKQAGRNRSVVHGSQDPDSSSS